MASARRPRAPDMHRTTFRSRDCSPREPFSSTGRRIRCKEHRGWTTSSSPSRWTPSETGWDWLSVQLRRRDRTHALPAAAQGRQRRSYSSGSYVDAQGKCHFLSLQDFSMTPADETWSSPETAAKYPIAVACGGSRPGSAGRHHHSARESGIVGQHRTKLLGGRHRYQR